MWVPLFILFHFYLFRIAVENKCLATRKNAINAEDADSTKMSTSISDSTKKAKDKQLSHFEKSTFAKRPSTAHFMHVLFDFCSLPSSKKHVKASVFIQM